MVRIFFLLKGNTELPRNPKQKIVSVDFLTFVTYSVLLPLSLCFWFYFWYNRKRKVTVIEIQLKKKNKNKKKRAHINVTMVEC